MKSIALVNDKNNQKLTVNIQKTLILQVIDVSHTSNMQHQHLIQVSYTLCMYMYPVSYHRLFHEYNCWYIIQIQRGNDNVMSFGQESSMSDSIGNQITGKCGNQDKIDNRMSHNNGNQIIKVDTCFLDLRYHY
jgi:hypothetical protein